MFLSTLNTLQLTAIAKQQTGQVFLLIGSVEKETTGVCHASCTLPFCEIRVGKRPEGQGRP